MKKAEILQKMIDLDATLKVTFKLPKAAFQSLETPTRLSMKDTDFVETEILRMFYINVSRVVPFQFYAYPEDRAYNNENNFVGLHYHAIVKSKNDAKFIKIAEAKYRRILVNKFSQFASYSLPKSCFYIEPLVSAAEAEADQNAYESYCLKQYCPTTKRLISNATYSLNKIAA